MSSAILKVVATISIKERHDEGNRSNHGEGEERRQHGGWGYAKGGGSREFESEGCACSGEAWVSDQQGKEQWEGEIDVRGGR